MRGDFRQFWPAAHKLSFSEFCKRDRHGRCATIYEELARRSAPSAAPRPIGNGTVLQQKLCKHGSTLAEQSMLAVQGALEVAGWIRPLSGRSLFVSLPVCGYVVKRTHLYRHEQRCQLHRATPKSSCLLLPCGVGLLSLPLLMFVLASVFLSQRIQSKSKRN